MTRSRRNGISLLYAIVTMVTLSAFVSLSVDYGRVQLAKNELRRAADAAARAGAAGIPDGTSDAITFAQDFAKKNKVDGVALALDSKLDIEFMKWDLAKGTGTKLTSSNLSTANAIHITARRTPTRGNGIPLMFASMIGMKSFNVSAESIAMVVPPVDVDQDIQATANPFLSGAKAGTVASAINPHNSPDYAGTSSNPKQSPDLIKMSLVEGMSLSFDTVAETRHDPNLAMYQPDGQLDDVGHNNPTKSSSNAYNTKWYNENGIADMKAPINALVGVFLDDKDPSSTPTPANLDFSSESDRNFKKLKPELKQIFFIGDGKSADGTQQEFIVPKGATRLFLATWDFYEWNNNAGYREVIVRRPMQIITVK